MKHILKKITIFSLLFILAQIIHASEDNKEVQKSYSSSTSFSFLLTSGNTDDRSLGLDTEQNWKSNKNHFQFKGSVIYSESEGAKDTEFYYSHFQGKVELKSKAYILGFGKLERNVLSGYNYRLALTVGAGYFWTKSEKFVLSSEAAFGWSLENNIKKDTDSNYSLSFPSLLISNSAQLALSSNSELVHQDIILFNLENFADYRISSHTSVSISISKLFSFKTSCQLKYSHNPVPGFKSTDQYLLSSLVLNF
jgi:putative salt-induced outer membrane protein YdiY